MRITLRRNPLSLVLSVPPARKAFLSIAGIGGHVRAKRHFSAAKQWIFLARDPHDGLARTTIDVTAKDRRW